VKKNFNLSILLRERKAYVADAGKDFAFHVVADGDAEGVGGVETEVEQLEVVLEVADALALYVAVAVDQAAPERVAAGQSRGPYLLLDDKREAHERIGAAGAQPDHLAVDTVVPDGRDAEDERVVLLPSVERRVLIVAINGFTVAAGQCQCNRK